VSHYTWLEFFSLRKSNSTTLNSSEVKIAPIYSEPPACGEGGGFTQAKSNLTTRKANKALLLLTSYHHISLANYKEFTLFSKQKHS
jgi:hypothetical protein